jgi:DNA-binding NarL/FixJ family response regulator/signal transduction histidine kinase
MYLTPAAIGYLTQIVLVSAIVGFFTYHTLGRQRPDRPTHAGLLTGFFAATTAFILELFFEAASPPARRLQVVYLENTTTGLILILLLQFAYHFPDLPPRQKWEARVALGLSVLYTLFEASFAVYRFAALGQGQVYFRPRWPDYVLVLGFLWVPVVFVRQAVRASRQARAGARRAVDVTDLMPAGCRRSTDPDRLRSTSAASGGPEPRRPALAHLWRPRGRAARAARSFSLVYLLPVGMALANLLRSYRLIPAGLYHASMSVGLLFSLFFFAIAYLNAIPETTTFMVKLVGGTLVALLAMLGLVAWNIMPTYVESYRAASPEGRTLRFMPNDGGGYDVAEVPFQFDHDLGDDLRLADALEETASVALDFAFPFYGQTYALVYVMNDGAVGLDAPVDHRTIQYHYGPTPAIFPLYIDLIPQVGEGGIFARRDADRLVITWQRVPAFHAQQTTYTFQLVLHQDGVFEVAYDGIPPELTFRPDNDPEDDVWLVGAAPGNPARAGDRRALPQQADFAALPVAGGPQGVVFDYYLAFRRQLHHLFAPLARLIVVSSLTILLGFPLIFHVNLVRPLNALLRGVQRLEAGDYAAHVPVQYTDEIGFLTRVFNDLAAQLGDLIRNLEARVAARTAELSARTEELRGANARLRAEIKEREQAQATIIEQQRALATLGERERLGRELHDGLGQLMGYINVEAQTVETMLSAGQIEPAQANLRRIAQTAQEAHADIRSFILGLRALHEDVPRRDFWEALRDRLHQFQTTYGIETGLNLPDGAPLPSFGPAVEEQLLHIIQEVLTNVRKHAAARRVEVLFSLTATTTHVIVADDGIGFDARGQVGKSASQQIGIERQGASAHFGLKMMRERAEAVGGQVEIRSTPGQGTCVLIHLPCLLAEPDVEAGMSGLAGLRLLLVDDHPLFLEGLRNLLTARGFTVVGVAHDGNEAVQQAQVLQPDVIVMDVQMPDCDGLEATRAIKAENPEVKIVMLTVADDDAHLLEAIKSGASGYLLKSLDANEFCALLTGVLRGEAALAPGIAARIMAEFSRPGDHEGRPYIAELTPRQKEVLGLVAQGLIYKEVAQRLHLSEKTIKYHMGRILEKLHVENRAQAIAYYVQQTQE